MTYFNDTWAYDPVANTWTELHPPATCRRRGLVTPWSTTQATGKVILFGGCDETGYLDDTWSFGISTAPTSTTLSSPVDAERVFMKELAPDFISWVSVIRDRQANNATDEAVHRELQRLQQQWTGRQAPSTRTQAFLDGWLTDLGTCEKYWALIVKNDAAGAEAMTEEVDQAILGAHLPETLSAILADLRITTDDVGEIMNTTTTR